METELSWKTGSDSHEKRPPKSHMWVNVRFTNTHQISRPESTWPEVWTTMCKKAIKAARQTREKKKKHKGVCTPTWRASSTFRRKSKITKTSFETRKRNWKDQQLPQCRLLQEHKQLVATSAGGDPSQSLGTSLSQNGKYYSRTNTTSPSMDIIQSSFFQASGQGRIKSSRQGNRNSRSPSQKDPSTLLDFAGNLAPAALGVGRTTTHVQWTSRALWRQCQRRHRMQNSILALSHPR